MDTKTLEAYRVKDRRASKRYPALGLPIKLYRKLLMLFSMEVEDCTAMDISEGGIGVLIDSDKENFRPKINQSVRLIVGQDPNQIEITGRIVNLVKMGRKIRIGIMLNEKVSGIHRLI